MNEVVALLVDAAEFESVEAARTRAAVLAVAKTVLARGGRLLVHGDSPTVALLAAVALEYRVVQAVETVERRTAPLIIVGGFRADVVEDRLFSREQDNVGGDLGELERFGVVETMPSVLERALTEAYERYSPVAAFLVGRGDRLVSAAEDSHRHHRRTQMPLYATVDVPWTADWNRIDSQLSPTDYSTPTLEGRSLKGEDAEVAARADSDARVAVAVETIIDRLIPDTRRQLLLE